MQINFEKQDVANLAEEVAKIILNDNRFNPKETKNAVAYLTRFEAAKALRISLPTIDSYCRQGILPSFRIGKRILFDKDDIETFVTKGIRYSYSKRGGAR